MEHQSQNLLEHLPGNPYHFEGSEQYFMNMDLKRRAFYDGIKMGKQLYTKKREPIGDCPICMDTIDQGYVTTDCGHTICLSCFNNTLSKLNNNCPLCRSVMVTGVVPSRKLDISCRESYHNGFEDGYTSGLEYMEEIVYTINNEHKDKMNALTRKYVKLNRVYKGTVRQLQNTHTLNFQQNKGKILFRTSSFDSYLKGKL